MRTTEAGGGCSAGWRATRVVLISGSWTYPWLDLWKKAWNGPTVAVPRIKTSSLPIMVAGSAGRSSAESHEGLGLTADSRKVGRTDRSAGMVTFRHRSHRG